MTLTSHIGAGQLRRFALAIAFVVAAPLGVAPGWSGAANAQIFESGTLPGKLVFWRISRIATPVSGRIAALPVRVGDRVKKGDVIAEIETQQLKADLAVAQSALAAARSNLGSAEAKLVLEQTTYDRNAKLKGSPAFSGARFDDASNNVAVAKADAEAARSLIAVRQSEVEKRELDVRLATIQAQFDGVVVRHLLTVGGLVSIEDPHILVMVDDTAPEIEVETPVANVGRFARGSEVEVSIADGDRQKARVRAVLPAETQGAATRLVRLELINPPSGPIDDTSPVTVYLPSS